MIYTIAPVLVVAVLIVVVYFTSKKQMKCSICDSDLALLDSEKWCCAGREEVDRAIRKDLARERQGPLRFALGFVVGIVGIQIILFLIRRVIQCISLTLSKEKPPFSVHALRSGKQFVGHSQRKIQSAKFAEERRTQCRTTSSPSTSIPDQSLRSQI